jgi:hypothetical protein
MPIADDWGGNHSVGNFGLPFLVFGPLEFQKICLDVTMTPTAPDKVEAPTAPFRHKGSRKVRFV